MNTPNTPIYDVIGDLHGYVDELLILLSKLGYKERNGVYAAEGRRAVFLGDFIEREPKIREVLQIVRAMVTQGSALAVMGNHEFNAICYHTPDGKGDFLRSHSEQNGKNTQQHQKTIDQLVQPFPEEWLLYLEWFKELPFFLDLSPLRVVHASWDARSIEIVRNYSCFDSDFLAAAATKGSTDYGAVERLLKGPELPLPEWAQHSDKEGNVRSDMRIAWWKPPRALKNLKYRDIAVPGAERLPDATIPAEEIVDFHFYGPDEFPVIFGHYWLPPGEPSLLSANAVCLDYSVAKAGGRLVSYSWGGESKLQGEHLSSVGSSAQN